MNEEQITRRQFLRTAVAWGGAVVAVPVLGACSPRELETTIPGPTPRATARPSVSPEATSTSTSAPSPTASPIPISTEEKLMTQVVYCTKCGSKNKEGAEQCVKCGADLEVTWDKRLEKRAEEWGEEFGRRAEEWGDQFGKRVEDECFGLPHGGTIFGLLFGIIIIIVGVLWITGITFDIWPFFVLIVGVLILAGALYTLTRKQKR